jgi:hypothetical protein
MGNNKNNLLELDFSEQIKASTTTNCDNCQEKLGDSYPRGKDVMQAALHMGKDSEGYDQYKLHHFCSEACMRQHLNKRAGIMDSYASIAEGAKKPDLTNDHKDQYGDVEYADPANHKYPINSEERVRAAWSYINMPKNQKGYSPEQVAAIKSKIKSKFKEYGITESK